MQKKAVIVGCGGHGRSVADILLKNQGNILIQFVDNSAKPNESFRSIPIVKKQTFKTKAIYCGIGDNVLRQKIFSSYKFETLVSKDAYRGECSNIGTGTIIAHNVHIGPYSKIGRGCIINTRAILDHEVTVGDFSHISIGSTICGKVRIGKRVFVGAGVVIRDGVKITNDVIIGCGAVVVKNITKKGIYIGCPARLKK